jgi:hypothetical protein
MNEDIDLPPPKVLQQSLRKITEWLARELASPAPVAPDWSDFEWRIARAVAAMHGVSSLLAGALRWGGPSGWEQFLREQKAHTTARHPRIQELLKLIDGHARSEGIALVALKGAELHASGLYLPGERPMADVDLLVGSEHVERAMRMLESLGFHESLSNWRHKVFVPHEHTMPRGLGEHANNYLKIELHERVQEALPVDRVDITRWVFPAQPHPGLNRYPSKAALMSHLLLHAAGAMANRALRLIHLHDIALLSRRMADEDWSEVLRYGADDHGHWWALPPLRLTARYYTHAVPTRVSIALAADCPRLLRATVLRRTLSDVSLSRLRIDAFPGIEWSQSAAEMVRYVMSRVRPGQEMLALRKQMVRTQAGASQSEWDRMSQGRRMARWILSRSARSETMYNVRAALAQAQ